MKILPKLIPLCLNHHELNLGPTGTIHPLETKQGRGPSSLRTPWAYRPMVLLGLCP